MSKNISPVRVRGIMLGRGRGPRQMYAKERISVVRFKPRRQDGLPQTLSSRVFGWYQMNSPFFRAYHAAAGNDDKITFQLGIKTCATAIVSTPGVYAGQVLSTVSGIFTSSQDGTPTRYDVPSERQEYLAGQTHAQLTCQVTSMSLKTDTEIVVEVWGNAWSRKFQSAISQLGLQPNDAAKLSYANSDMRANLDSSRQRLTE